MDPPSSLSPSLSLSLSRARALFLALARSHLVSPTHPPIHQAADAVVQIWGEGKDTTDKFDFKRNAVFAAFGFGYLGCKLLPLPLLLLLLLLLLLVLAVILSGFFWRFFGIPKVECAE